MRTVVALAVLMLATQRAESHTFPASRTVVVQVEAREVAVLVAFRPGTGEASEAILARAASQPKGRGLETLRDILTTAALAPLAIAVDGVPLAPTSVRAKIGTEPGGARPMVVVLVTYGLPQGKQLVVRSSDPRATRFSWSDRDSHRVELADAPAQGRWFDGAASLAVRLRRQLE